jgi:hypothetical protein
VLPLGGLYPALKVGQVACAGRDVGQEERAWRGRAGGYLRADHRSDHRADGDGKRRRLTEALDHHRTEHPAAGECRHQAGVSGRERADALGRPEITGYQDGCWASFKHWQQIGAQVRMGEKGTPIVFWSELPLALQRCPICRRG